jgi:hypothetical protein
MKRYKNARSIEWYKLIQTNVCDIYMPPAVFTNVIRKQRFIFMRRFAAQVIDPESDCIWKPYKQLLDEQIPSEDK